MKRRGFLKALVAAVAAPAAVKAAVESPEAIGPKVEHVDPAEWGMEPDWRPQISEKTIAITGDAPRLSSGACDTILEHQKLSTAIYRDMLERQIRDAERRKLIAEWTIADANKPWGSP